MVIIETITLVLTCSGLMVGEQLKSMRTERGVTQHALSRAAGWTQPYTSMLERRNREISLPKVERYLSALQTAAALAAQARESQKRAEAELLARFEGNTTHVADPPVSAPPSSFTLDAELAGYAEGVERLTAACGKPKTLGDGTLVFARTVNGILREGIIVTQAGWKRVDPKGVTVESGTDFGGLL